MEPGYGLHENQRGVQALLCGAHGEAFAGNGATELSQWVQNDLPSGCARNAAKVEKATDDFCEFDERPIPQGCAGGVY